MEAAREPDIVLIILLGTTAVLLLVGFLALFILLYQRRVLTEKQKRADAEMAFQAQMIRLQFDSQEQERRRISADLHDSMGSLLWAAKLSCTFIQRSVRLEGEAFLSYKELSGILDECISLARKIAWELTPEAFQYTGLTNSLASLCQRLHGKGCEVNFRREGDRTWNGDRALQVFRISQELISNALKHSGATRIEVALTYSDDRACLTVRDNGTGFTKTEENRGVGLWNIRQRINAVNGEIQMGLPPNGTGTEVTIKVLLESESK
jgi:signal transduction histidine kinase